MDSDFSLFIPKPSNNEKWDGLLAEWYYLGVIEELQNRFSERFIDPKDLMLPKIAAKLFFCKMLELIPENSLCKNRNKEPQFLEAVAQLIMSSSRSIEEKFEILRNEFVDRHYKVGSTWD